MGHEKRLSYGGVGLLFDANTEINNNAVADNTFDPHSQQQHRHTSPNPLNVSFKPSYEGIAGLFDESNDILQSNNKHKVKASFAGDIVELFVNPSHDDQNNDNESNEESDDDGMDEQRQYDYDDDDDNEEEEEENEDRMEKIEENKSST